MVKFSTEKEDDLKGLEFVTAQHLRNDTKEVGKKEYSETVEVTLPRTVDVTERFHENMIDKRVDRFLPAVNVAEITREIPIEKIEYDDTIVEIPQKKIIDKYVEVPVLEEPPIIKRVPLVETIEREVKSDIPMTKIIDKIVEVPRVHEVVRYVESGTEVEQIIRYVPSGPLPKEHYRELDVNDKEYFSDEHGLSYSVSYEKNKDVNSEKISASSESNEESSFERIEVVKVEAERVETGDEPELTIPVPYLVPKVNTVEVEVPIIKFVDHFVPVPIRRHVIPEVTFTNEIYEVETIHEKPILVVQDNYKPVAVNTKIDIIEKELEVVPIDPQHLSQADINAMWMRCNADLLDLYQMQHEGNMPFGYAPDAKQGIQRMPPSQYEQKLLVEEKERQLLNEGAQNDPGLRNPHSKPQDDSLPITQGHPNLGPVLQNQWLNANTLESAQLYHEEYRSTYMAALDGLQNPQPHVAQLSAEQVERIRPMPEDIMPQPWQYVHKSNAERPDAAINLDGVDESVKGEVYAQVQDALSAKTEEHKCCAPCQ